MSLICIFLILKKTLNRFKSYAANRFTQKKKKERKPLVSMFNVFKALNFV